MSDDYEDKHGTLTPEKMESMSVSDWDARLDAYRLGVSGQPDQIFQLYRDADDALQKTMDDDRFRDADLTLAGVSGGKDVAIFYLRTIDLAIDGGSEFFLDARM